MAEPCVSPSRRSRLARVMLFTLIALGGLYAGFQFRLWTFETTTPIRWELDLQNAWQWGNYADEHGLLSTYDLVRYEKHETGDYGLDYVPLRLTVAWYWVKTATWLEPGLEGWSPSLRVNAPLLAVHYLMELIATAGLFAIVFTWCRRLGGAKAKHALWWALACAAVLYLNPASVINSFGRPGTDTWVLPFYTWAVWCAMTGRWWGAGMIIGLGAMIKGQVMLGGPVFLLWALFMGRPTQALRWLAGVLFGGVVVLLPWLLTAWPFGAPRRVWTGAGLWLLPIALGCVAFGVLVSKRAAAMEETERADRRFPVYLIIAAGLLALIVAAALLRGGWGWAVGLALATSGCLVWARWGGAGQRVPALGLLFAQAALSCMVLFGAGDAWFEVGPWYGAHKFSYRLEMGGAMCLAGIMQMRFRTGPDDVLFALPWLGGSFDVTAWRLLMGIFAALYVVACAAITRQFRRGGPHFLIAICTPWLVWFAFAAQIHERYLLFGAGLAAATLAVHRGAFVLSLLLSTLSWLMTAWVMLQSRTRGDYLDGLGDTLHGLIRPLIPDAGWAVMLIALIFLWLSFTGASSHTSNRQDANDAEEAG
ncbi:MAG: hypothetical protein GVY24_02095 [Planctomycetes bacterium]|jgi:hypothetical protein|nr:hypothetical protein [Planctomycetota bacterium]